MIRLLYWALAGVLAATIIHIGMVVYLPKRDMASRIASAAEAKGMNALSVAGPESGSILGYGAGDAVYAFCPFDVKDNKLVLDAYMPPSLWSLSIYSARGDNVYSVNSRQAGVDNFQITVRKAPDFLTQVTSEAEPGQINDGWRVETSDERGLIVMWAAVPEPFQREAIAGEMARSACKAAPE